MAKLKTIYQYFQDYTRAQIDTMILKLTLEERALIRLRYGLDLDNPVSGKLTADQNYEFYGMLVPKMKKLLANPNYKQRARKKSSKNEKIVVLDDELVDVSVKNEETYIEEIVESKEEKVDFTKDDCVKILELLKKPTFSQLLDVLTMKEAIIFSLKLGFVDNKYFKTEAIAKFLGIREEEVIDVTKKALLIYRENFNVFLENIIEKATDEVGEARVLSLNKK